MHVHQIMTRQVIVVGPDATMVQAARTMLRNHISGLPVVDTSGKLIGVVSEGDFIRRAEAGTQRKHDRWLKFILGSRSAAGDFVREQGRNVGEVMTREPFLNSAKDEKVAKTG